jgi:hypothetical protein
MFIQNFITTRIFPKRNVDELLGRYNRDDISFRVVKVALGEFGLKTFAASEQ